eukprot:TRINITY_DN5011_c1_g1_i1.p1 TRINITY_DN5011_c1_g1~~TRINITY_DN5011_c1_g1_i1.p1  ORF type:complete len:501 (-),score=64.78 TRINITY_DN5011_c1_g1_i1:878-2380(-)
MDTSFYQALASEDIQVRIDTVRKLVSFAELLGPQRTLNELFPAISDIGLLEDDDELLVVLADELGKFLPFVGESNVAPLYQMLEILLRSEDSPTRLKATESLLNLATFLSDVNFETHFISLVIRLAESEWYIPQIAACSLFPEACRRANQSTRLGLIPLFVTLCKGEIPMVRRAAATHLKTIVSFISPEVFLTNFLDVYELISKDEQDSVRFLAVELAASLASTFLAHGQTQNSVTLVKPVVLACAQDASWRVRYMVANCFVDIANGLGAEITKSILYVFVNLLKDSEVEVRSAASGRISGVSKLLDVQEVIGFVLPCIGNLIKDESQQVRKALASDVILLSGVFGTKGTDEYLLPILLQLLKDDVPEVRLNVISKLDQVTPIIGLDKLSEFLIPAIVELGENSNWRIRHSVIKHIPPLARQLSVEFFSEKLAGLCYGWLTDSVYAIRQAAIGNLKELTVVYGEDFTRFHIIPKVLVMLVVVVMVMMVVVMRATMRMMRR